MEFGWHEAKRDTNIQKHGVDFADVFAAFQDPARLIAIDDRHAYGERRYNLLGRVRGRIYHVTYTERGEVVWLISARKANTREQARYARR